MVTDLGREGVGEYAQSPTESRWGFAARRSNVVLLPLSELQMIHQDSESS